MQTRAGVQHEAARLTAMVRDHLPQQVEIFVAEQRFVVLSSVDRQGRVWTSLRTGDAGFLSTPNPGTLSVSAPPVPGDPLEENLAHHPEIGVLVMDLKTHRRFRVNGTAAVAPHGLAIQVREAYPNCAKYIQTRDVRWTEAGNVVESIRLSALTEFQRQWIANADTFFMGSAHPQHGADSSHRGGQPGFVQVIGDKVVFADYPGNNMFNSLGNVAANPRVGLLFVDFETGATLQITGAARIVWERSRPQAIEVVIDEAIQTTNATRLRFGPRHRSP